MVMYNKDIEGILYNNAEIKILLYADDTTFIIDGSEQSLITALFTLDIYGAISIKTDKTQSG